MDMDNIKLFSKNGNELEILTQAMTIYSQDIGMNFGHANEKWKMEKNRTTNSRKKSECSEKRKLTSAWEYCKRTPSNKWRWKKRI